MTKLLFMTWTALLPGLAIATQTTQIDQQVVARAKAVAIAKGMNLAEFKQPRVSRMNDGTWVVHFEHVQRYLDKQPIYMVDDCFGVLVDGHADEATFHPCP